MEKLIDEGTEKKLDNELKKQAEERASAITDLEVELTSMELSFKTEAMEAALVRVSAFFSGVGAREPRRRAAAEGTEAAAG